MTARQVHKNMDIQISNGVVKIKDFCSRKTKKLINKELFSSVNIKGNKSGDSNFEGFTMEALDRANDVALINMVEKIIINEKEVPVTIEVFDEMNTKDTDIILEEINKITNKELGNK